MKGNESRLLTHSITENTIRFDYK